MEDIMVKTVKMTTFFALLAIIIAAASFLLPVTAGAAEAPLLTLTSTDASPVYGDDLNFTFDAQTDSGSGLASVLAGCTADDFELWYDGAALSCTIDIENKTIVCTDDIGAGDNTFTLKYIGTAITELVDLTTDSVVNIAKADASGVAAPTTSAITYGQTLGACTLSDGWSWADATVVPSVVNSGYAAVMNLTDDDNYDYSGGLCTYDENAHTLTYTVPVTVSKATPVITVTADITSGAAGEPVAVVATAENPDNNTLTDVPVPVLSYKVGDGAAQSFDGSFNIPADATVGAVITITAQTAESDNYAAASGTASVTVAPAVPVFDPADGTEFKKSLEISITCDAQGAAVYYTTDGTEPTESSTLYTAPFTVNATTTVKAIAVSGGISGEVVSATYTKKTASDSGSAGGGGGGGGGYGGGHYVGEYIPPEPELNGESMDWAKMAEALAKLPFGSETTIWLHGNYEVPVEVITAIADNELKVTFVVNNARSWFTDGADIEQPCAADLRVVQNKDIDASELTGLVGTRFSADGTNIPTDLITSFRKKHGGRFAYLYKKTDSGFVFDAAAKIGEGGKVSFPLSEGGDYVIMIKDHSPVFGDVNDDGLFTADDAWAVLMDYVELKEAPNPEQLDFNGDGKLTPADASAIAKALL